MSAGRERQRSGPEKASAAGVESFPDSWKTVLENMFEPVLVTDPEGKIIEWNRAAEKLYGYRREEMLGRSAEILNRPGEGKKITREIMAALGERGRWRGEINFVGKDGSAGITETTVVALPGPDGKLGAIASFDRDVTAARKAEEELRDTSRNLEGLFKSIQDGISILDTDLTVRRVNAAMNRWYGENLPLEGKKCFRAYQNREAPCDPCPSLRCLETGETEIAVVPGLPGSEVEWLEVFSYPLRDPRDGRVTGVVEFVRDITERKRLEEQQSFAAAFQGAVAEISARFVSDRTEEEFDREVEAVLRRLGELFDLDRGYLFRFSPDLSRMTNTHEWCAGGVVPQREVIRNFPSSALPWWRERILRRRPVLIPEVEELPEEAAAEKQEFGRQDIKSLVCLPLVGGRGDLLGFIGFDAVRQSRSFPDDQVAMLQVVAGIVAGAIERQQAAESLRRRLAQEQIVSRVSSLAVESPAREGFYDQALAAMGETLEVSRAYIFEHRHESGTMDNTSEWIAPGVSPQKEELQGVPASAAPWWVETLSGDGVINYSDIEEIPDRGAREILRRGQVLSILVVPIFASGRYWGFMGFDDCSRHRAWPPEDVELLRSVSRIISAVIERDRAERELRRLEWLLTEKPVPEEDRYIPSYGDLAELNTDGLILSSVGRPMLTDIVRDYLDLLETSAAVYEKNGDYALGIFSSGWCRFLDEASRRLCATGDNREALSSGRWLCHESCWTNASKTAIETGQPVDIECEGGLRIYSVPIRAGGEVVGALNFGYGDPPRDPATLAELAARYEVDEEELRAHSEAYECRPSYLIEIARRRAVVSARLIGEIVERRQAETATRESEEFIRAVMDNLPIGVAVNPVDPEVEFSYMNDRFPAIYRVTREALASGSFWEVVYEDPVFRKQLKKRVVDDCLSGDPDRMQWDDVPFTRNGEQYYISARNIPIPGKNLMISTVWDVTDRKKAEEALRESEERYRTILERSFSMVYLHDLDGNILEVNKAAEMGTGYPREELLRMGVFDLHEDESGREDIVRQWKNWPVGQSVTLETRHRHRDGSLFPVEVTTGKVAISDREYILATVRDITDRKKAEAERERLQRQLAQSQKLESVGRLAGGVAHDFNNMLNVILGRGELALRALGDFHPTADDIREVLGAARSSADLTRQLLAFARKQTASPRVLDLNETVSASLKMLRRLIGEGIELEWNPGGGLWPVRIDPTQVEQIITNLCLNARDALGGMGRVTISTANAAVDEKEAACYHSCRPGDYVLLSVSDTGPGMDAETLSRIFEPFFTTKEPGMGTGLGLSMVYGIVEQNGGCVGVESVPGEGTLFRVFLPRYLGQEERLREAVSTPSASPGQETILAVEDDPANLRLTTRILKSQGYRVLAAATPGEAIALAREHQGEIDLLLTDVVMPEMNGRSLAKNLIALYPKIKRLFMSGYTADVIAHHGVIEDGVDFIQKPFTVDGLLSRVREVLDAGS